MKKKKKTEKKETRMNAISLSAKSIHATRECLHLDDGTTSLGILLSRSKSTTHGTSKLGAEVKRDVLLASVELTELTGLSLIDDSKNTSNVLASHTDLRELGCCTTGDLSNTKVGELTLKLSKLLEKLVLGLLTEFVGLNLRHYSR